MATAYPYPSYVPRTMWTTPIVPPLEPLPLDELSTIAMSPLPRSYRRRCTAALAMLMADCHGNGHRKENEDELRCRYPSKLCRNLRVRKTSGALHRYCAFHRDKANANQKRWVGRRRGGTSPTASSTSSCSSPVSSALSSPSSAKSEWMAAAFLVEPSASAATLSDDEWDALLCLLEEPPVAVKTLPSTTLRVRRKRSGAAMCTRRSAHA